MPRKNSGSPASSPSPSQPRDPHYDEVASPLGKVASLMGETMVTPTDLAKRRSFDVSTFWRWIRKGVGGIVLESIRIGGRTYTTEEAFVRFVARTTAAASRDDDRKRPTRRQRDADVNKAERELARDGI